MYAQLKAILKKIKYYWIFILSVGTMKTKYVTLIIPSNLETTYLLENMLFTF